MKKLINTTKTPSLPFTGAVIESHDTSLGKIDISKLELYLSPNQEGGKYIEGNKLREELKGKPVLNATVLDYLWEHQDQIPESWKEKTSNGYTQFIYFWGTVYRNPVDGRLFVRYLFFFGGAWDRSYRWLDRGWSSRYPAALLASDGPKSSKSLTQPFDPLSLEVTILGKKYKLKEVK